MIKKYNYLAWLCFPKAELLRLADVDKLIIQDICVHRNRVHNTNLLPKT